jgi:Ni/Co efflux regulator RcnB
MSKTLSILVAAAFASASFGAYAADDAAKMARKQANDTYKTDKAACKPMKGDEKKDCMKQAKAKHSQAIADMKAMKKGDKASSGSSTPATPAPSK